MLRDDHVLASDRAIREDLEMVAVILIAVGVVVACAAVLAQRVRRGGTYDGSTDLPRNRGHVGGQGDSMSGFTPGPRSSGSDSSRRPHDPAP